MLGKRQRIIIMGARQVGKTTLIKERFNDKRYIMAKMAMKQMWPTIGKRLLPDLNPYLGITGQWCLTKFKESQISVPKLKLITDHIRHSVGLFLGSSSFDLVNKINEPSLPVGGNIICSIIIRRNGGTSWFY